MSKNLRDQAKAKLDEAYELLKRAGTPERLPDLTEDVMEWKDAEHTKDKDGWEYFQFLKCSICGNDHTMDLTVRKDARHNFQYTLEILIGYSYYGFSFWDKVKEVFRALRRIFKEGREEMDILLKGDDLTKFKDLLKRL